MPLFNENGVANIAAFSSDFGARQLVRQYIDVIDDEMGFMDFFDWTGRSEKTGRVTYENITEGSIFQTMVANAATTAGAAGANVTLAAKKTGAKPLRNETVLFKNNATAFVYNVVDGGATWTVTLMPPNATAVIPAIAANDEIVLFGNAQGEGGTTPDSLRRPIVTKRSNNVQMFGTKIDFTDLAGATEVEMEFQGKRYIFPKAKFQHLINHRMQIANTLLTGIKGKVVNLDGQDTYFTDGLRNQIKTGGGFNLSTITAGVFNLLDDQKALTKLMDAYRAPYEYILWAGQDLDLAIDMNSATNAAFTGGGISYGAYNGNKEIALALAVKSLTFGSRTIHKQRFKPAEHPSLFGAPGYDLAKKEGYLMPTNKVKTKDNGALDRLRVRYMAYNGTKDLRYLEFEDGLLAPNPNNAKRTHTYSIDSNQGLEALGIEHFGILTLS